MLFLLRSLAFRKAHQAQCKHSELLIESMQVASLPRILRRCSRPLFATAGGTRHVVLLNTTIREPQRTYHVSQRYFDKDSKQSIESQYTVKRLSDPSITAHSHPLSLQNLGNLSPDVPHVFTSRSNSPYFNLAVEHHLLTYSNPSSRILFTYTNIPCVIIGRNQNPWVECDITAITRGTSDGRSVALVRRRSGGGTVFHDEGNLNYTVIVPSDGFERKTHVQMVVDALERLRNEQFVFRRWQEIKANDRNDIVAKLNQKYQAEGAGDEWFKVSGTAFKLTKGRALHHGTLLHSSPYIDSIGTFLQSPGKSHITAKGVESVRSPVTNLWEVKKAKQRRRRLYD